MSEVEGWKASGVVLFSIRSEESSNISISPGIIPEKLLRDDSSSSKAMLTLQSLAMNWEEMVAYDKEHLVKKQLLAYGSDIILA